MTSWQRAVKYAATVFALFLAVSIISKCLSLVGLMSFFSDEEILKKAKSYSVSQDITDVKIDISTADFAVVCGEEISVESNLKNLEVKEEDGCLTVTHTKNKLGLSYNDKAKLTLYIPKDFVFENADISTGAGRVDIESLSAQELNIEFGAGEVDIKELNALDEAKIESGAGEVKIYGGTLCNLDFDMGVGETKLICALSGENKINHGIGEANLTLLGERADYCISLNKGMGNAEIDGKEMSDGAVYGNGEITVEVDGGIGEIDVDFEE